MTISTIIEKLKSEAEYPRADLIHDLESVQADLVTQTRPEVIIVRGGSETRN